MSRLFRHTSEHLALEITEDKGELSLMYRTLPGYGGLGVTVNRSELAGLIVYLETTLEKLNQPKKEKEEKTL